MGIHSVQSSILQIVSEGKGVESIDFFNRFPQEVLYFYAVAVSSI